MKTSKRIFIKNAKSKKNDTYPLYLRIIHRGKKCEGLISEIDCVQEKHLVDWNKKFERFETSLLDVNDIISKINIRYRETLIIERDNLKQLTASQLLALILERKKDLMVDSLLKIYASYIENDLNTNKNITEGTKRNHRKSYKHFITFLHANSLHRISISDFNPSCANKFKSYLLSIMSDVSGNSVLKNVKFFFERKLDEGLISVSPFQKIFIKFRKKHQPRLYPNNFAKLSSIDNLNYKFLELYVDIFKFLCYTGVTYKDLYLIKRSFLFNIQNDLKLDCRRVKTNVRYYQVLIEQAKLIIEKYKDHPNVIICNYLLPKRSLNEINKHLKVIGALIGLNTPLTTYYARRFFRQSVRESGVAVDLEIKTMMGHSVNGMIDDSYAEINDEILIENKIKFENYINKIIKEV